MIKAPKEFRMRALSLILPLLILLGLAFSTPQERPRLREFGLTTGTLPTGPLNAITDVAGVLVGQTTLIEGASVRTGVTAVLPHGGNIFQEKVPGAVCVANGFGKLAGSTQVDELGTIETPVVLTNTLSVPTAADAVIDYILGLPGNEKVESVNPVVGETNDGFLNDIRARAVRKEHVLAAIRGAKGGPVDEGAVGAGTGTICYGFKGGIGTSSRVLSKGQGGWTVGVLVQTNHGGVFQIGGIPVAERLRRGVGGGSAAADTALDPPSEGSCMIIVATDAPLDARNLKRLAKRALLGIARTGGYYSNGSGDYAVAFSTAKEVRVPHQQPSPIQTITVLRNDAVSPLFLAAAEAAEEAILNSMFRAHRVEGKSGHTAEALPLDKLKDLLK
jgi:D-aminopeptidase